MIQKRYNSILSHAVFAYTTALLIAPTAFTETWVRCDDCTAAQSEGVAIASGPEQLVVVFSARDNIASAFYTQTDVVGVGCQPLRPGETGGQKVLRAKNAAAVSAGQCSYVTVAQATALDATKQQLVDAFHGAYVETNGTMQKTAYVNIADIPNAPTGPGPVANDPDGITAYDVQNNVIVQTQLIAAATAYVTSASGQLNHLIASVASMVGVRFAGTEHQLNLIITFKDGSRAQLDFTLHTDKPELYKAEDPNGVPVMVVGAGTAPQYVGDHGFNSNRDLTNFLNNAALNGVRIVDHHIGGTNAHCTSSIGEDGTVTVSCSMF
jgi:hypothetical protein